MYGFIKKCFFTASEFISTLTSVYLLIAALLSCISMNKQEYKIRPQIINVNSEDSVFFSVSIKISKFSGSCKNINNPYAKMCVPDVAKNLHINVLNRMSRTNETRHIEWLETCKGKCKLDASVFNNKQRWNKVKCRCEYKNLIDKGVCDKRFIWNSSNCEC